MEQHYAALITLLEKLSHLRSSEDIGELERVATDYEVILNKVYQAGDYYKSHTKSHIRRVPHIESGLHEAKYGTSHKQRDAAFKEAKQDLYADIDTLATLVKTNPELLKNNG